MKCPACKEEDHRVLETREVSDLVTRRRHQCVNRHRWSSYARVDMATLDATRSGQQPLPVASATTTRSVRPKEVATTTRSALPLPVAFASRSTGGRGGSDLVPSSPSKPLTQTRVERPSVTETAAFIAFYEAYPRKKARPDALRAWVRQGCEAISTAVMAGLRAHLPELAAREPDKVPYPASWLNDTEWKDPPLAPRAADLRCHFHRSPGTGRQRPPAGWLAGCPECKHARAGTSTRTGEASSIADLAAETEKRLAAQRNVTPATPEQLAELRGAK